MPYRRTTKWYTIRHNKAIREYLEKNGSEVGGQGLRLCVANGLVSTLVINEPTVFDANNRVCRATPIIGVRRARTRRVRFRASAARCCVGPHPFMLTILGPHQRALTTYTWEIRYSRGSLVVTITTFYYRNFF